MEVRGFGGQEIGFRESAKSGNKKKRMIILLSSTAIKEYNSGEKSENLISINLGFQNFRFFNKFK